MVVYQQLLHLTMAEPHNCGALILGNDLQRVELGAHIADSDVFGEKQLTCFAINLDLDCGGVELIEGGVPAQRVMPLASKPPGSLADELPA
jgi:hypothetical protein